MIFWVRVPGLWSANDVDGGLESNSLLQSDDLPVAGVDLGEAQGEVVGLRAGVDEVADGELVGHGADDALRAQDDVVVQEAVVGVEDGHLGTAGLHHGGVAVTH
mgnify:CR=1 FL=1